ncbi:MAG: hypothetical protein J6L00_00685 [Clostridia bacterium]|nr:hypothetical protein [Clostridia bacterium]
MRDKKPLRFSTVAFLLLLVLVMLVLSHREQHRPAHIALFVPMQINLVSPADACGRYRSL